MYTNITSVSRFKEKHFLNQVLSDVTNPTTISRRACHLSISIHNLNLDKVSYGLEASKANKGPPFGLKYTVHSLFIYRYLYRFLSLLGEQTYVYFIYQINSVSIVKDYENN